MDAMNKETARHTAQEVMIPVEESCAGWHTGPKHVAAYDALENKFALLPLNNV